MDSIPIRKFKEQLVMEELKARIKALMHEIEFTHLKKNWVERMIALGVQKEDVYKWVAELGHVVDEYERSLRFLIDVLERDNIESAVRQLDGWIAYTQDITVWKLDDVMKELEGKYEKYLPPEPEDEDEPE